MTEKEQLKNLKSHLKAKTKDVSRLRNQIEALETKMELPKLKKKYEGKYFKCNDGYNDNDRWNKYIFVHKIVDIHYALMSMFESIPFGKFKHTYSIKEEESLSLCKTQITKEEFEQALVEFQAKAFSLSKKVL